MAGHRHGGAAGGSHTGAVGVEPLTQREADALAALCRVVVPEPTEEVDIPTAVRRLLGRLPPEVRAGFRTALRTFDHPLVVGVLSGSFRRFSALPAAAAERYLSGWRHSRVPLRRTLYEALRRPVLGAYYSEDRTGRAVGYAGPPHLRAPLWEWEGPLTAGPSAEEAAAGASAPSATVVRTGTRVSFPAPVPTSEGRLQCLPPLRDGAELRAGVCVVGTGAGGAVAAARLAEAGHDVLLLEEGGQHPAASLTEREGEMVPRLYADGGARATVDLSLPLLQGSAVGGSSLVNWMIMLRTPDWVLEEWAAEHGAEGLTPAELAPAFARIEAEVGSGEMPRDAHSPNNRILLEGARALGWSVRTARINARGCVRAGTCGLGCRHGAKRSVAATYLPRAMSAGARIACHVRVDALRVVERGGAAPRKRLECSLLDAASGVARGRARVEAPMVVLAAGAVGSPAILLRSALGGPQVGRWLRLHPTSGVAGVYPEEVQPGTGIPLSVYLDEFLRGDDGYGFWVECPPALPGLMATALRGHGTEHRETMRLYARLGVLIALVRDGGRPDRPAGRVRVDRRGRARVTYHLRRPERARMVAALGAAAHIHFAAGATEVRTLHDRGGRLGTSDDIPDLASLDYGPNRFGVFSAHVNGTCRLGGGGSRAVCDPEGRVRGVAGLYVLDGSLLPTAPGVNPQETIMAVASVLAERMAAAHGSG